MTEEDIESIIQRLKELQVHRDHIREEERQLLARAEDLLRPTSQTGRVSPEPNPRRETTPTFRTGEKVYITNRIRHVPGTRHAILADRACVVQRTTPDRVYIRTYNGYETWRAANNLRLLSESERRIIEE